MEILNRIKGWFNSFINMLDNGKMFINPMKWVYWLFAGISILFPIAATVAYYDAFFRHYFDYGNGWEKCVTCIMLLLFFAIMAMVAFFFFTYWTNRAKHLNSVAKVGDEIVAVPLVANYVQCGGEWMGFNIASIGISGGLLMTVFMLLTGNFDSNLFTICLAAVIGGSVVGWSIALISRFIAERIILSANMANDIRYHVNKERAEDAKKENN